MCCLPTERSVGSEVFQIRGIAMQHRDASCHRPHRFTAFLISLTLIALALPVWLGKTAAAQQGNPAAAYSFDEGIGTTVGDASGNAITGTIVGATWTSAGKYGNALSFNGTSSYVNLGNPTSLRITGSMTWSAWVLATGDPPDDGQIVAKSNNSSGWQLKSSPDMEMLTASTRSPSFTTGSTWKTSIGGFLNTEDEDFTALHQRFFNVMLLTRCYTPE
jgi:hypothetical protein